MNQPNTKANFIEYKEEIENGILISADHYINIFSYIFKK